MGVVLEGGCRVTELREGEAVRHGTLTVWSQFGRSTGAHAISLRILECSPGSSPGFTNRDCEEVLYVVEGQGTVYLGGRPWALGAETGIYLAPGISFDVRNPGPGPLVVASCRCPEPESEPPFRAAGAGPADRDPVRRGSSEARPPVVGLWEREAQPTADRWYRVLVDAQVGCRNTTQFVGSIPPCRAPDHSHQYEEVLTILRGEGVLWAGRTSTPIGVGSCVFLPRGQVHCVENTGRQELRLLGVFHPAGSPAVRYESG